VDVVVGASAEEMLTGVRVPVVDASVSGASIIAASVVEASRLELTSDIRSELELDAVVSGWTSSDDEPGVTVEVCVCWVLTPGVFVVTKTALLEVGTSCVLCVD